MENEIKAGCGMIIRESEGYVCPYFCRHDEWEEKNGKCGSCQIDLQLESNVCLYGLIQN